MSRWVNGSLEDLLMVSISPRAFSRTSTLLRAEQELGEWDGDSLGVAVPAPPTVRNVNPVAEASAFRDDLATDALNLGLRLLVVDSLTRMLPDEPENVGFFTHASSVIALGEALDRVRSRAADARVVSVLAPDTSLGAYVKGLYLRASKLARALEVFGFEGLEGDGDSVSFARAAEEAAGFHFADLRDSVRRELAALRIELGQTSVVRALRDAVEQLFVANDRLA